MTADYFNANLGVTAAAPPQPIDRASAAAHRRRARSVNDPATA